MTPTIAELRERYYYQLFRIGVFLKGLDAIVEMFAGLVILFIGPITISNVIISASQDELAEQPHSFIALHALPIAHLLSLTPQKFLAAYLLARGLIKLFLVAALLLNRRWSYPSALIVLGIFLIYEVYLFILGHSFFLLALILFDTILLALIAHEYSVSQRTTLVSS
ncbi:MAG TPA: DUF2127 domain-containing protein [Candidatus Paceibacterota bacterium]|nr:DUF2127 domain-containing protein [Candidatus Paceibacterota bacterium]